MKTKYIFPVAIALFLAIVMGACRDVFEVDSSTEVDETNMYRNVDDADAAVLGIYSKFLDIAKEYVVLNEVRADLIDVTDNADADLMAVNNHTVEDGNSYANPRPFYKVILNCNDVLKHFKTMYKNSLLTEAEYNERYSDITALRSWIYLQLAIHYGNIPYVTEPFDDVSDLSDESKYPYISLENIVDSLVNTVANLPYLDVYPTTEENLIGVSAGTYTSTPFFINKNMLLGDLYLWKGAVTQTLDQTGNYYLNAAKCYKNILDAESTTDFQKLRMSYASVSDHKDICVYYSQRYNVYDENGLIDSDEWGWRSIFCRTQDNYYYWEWLWQLFFDVDNGSSSPFIELFANYGQGKYLLKPSQQVIDLWNSQTQNNGFPYDARGKLSYTNNDGDPIVRKYLYEYDETVPYEKWGRMYLQRAAGLYLHYIEAANRDNKCKVALALLNTGIRYEFSPYWYGSYDTIRDITEYERTDGTVYNFSYPYDFDGRMAGSVSTTGPNGNTISYTQIPVDERGTYYQNTGVRGRAYVKPVLLDMYDPLDLTIDNTDALKDSIENYTIQEDALELAFEGQRWSDLLRVAIRRGDPSFIADKVYQKLVKSGNSNADAAYTKLMQGNYFLPFSLK